MARLVAGASVCVAGMALAGPGLSLATLDRLESGQWELRSRDAAGVTSRRCLDNGRGLIQLRHANLQCRSIVLDDGPVAVTVQYVCPGNGYGHTRIRVENARLAQIETQGVAGGQPFAFAAEARRTGACRP